MTPDPEVLGAFSADDPLEARVGKACGFPDSVSRESEITENLRRAGRARGAFCSAEVPFPTVDNGVARSRRKFTRPQFCKQPPENLTARLARAMSRSYGGRISLNLFGATSGSVLRNPTLEKKLGRGRSEMRRPEVVKKTLREPIRFISIRPHILDS